MDNRQELKKLLPYGGQKEIAKRLNVTVSLVSNYFSGLNNSELVEKEVCNYLAEIAENRRQLLIKALS
ncbi:MAG: hypothetical protein H6Q20_1271 [Bacteroidetes bacterium]|nr:hypothetical protein [Bacteroidota bacterium]